MMRQERLKALVSSGLSTLDSAHEIKICLGHSYVARGRIVNHDCLAICVLDNSEIAQQLRTSTHLTIEIDLGRGMCFRGEALITLGACVTSSSGRRLLEAVLKVEKHTEDASEPVVARWIT